ncbi:MAG: hypothetical protein ACPL4K_02875 [Candidatus Margulisiibacteriota bacterium]
MGLEQLNQQQLAVASNLSATQNIDQVLRSEFERKTDTDNATKIEESAIKKALEGKTGKLGIEIIANLASKLAQTLPTTQILSNLKEEYGFLLENKEETIDDAVMIKTPGEQIAKVQKQKQNLNSNSGFNSSEGEENLPQRPTTDIKEYIGAYSQMLINGGSEAKKKIEKLENQLLEEKGVSLKDLQNVKHQVANAVRSEILQQIKQAYLKQVLAKGKSLEWLISKKEAQNFIDFAFLNDRLGGYDFGGYEEHLQGAVDRVRDETHRELKDFVEHKLTEKVMQKAMGKEGKEIEKDIEDLLKLGQKIGFEVQEFVAKIPKLKEDLGLNPVIDFDYVAADTNLDNDRRGHRYQYTPEEEKEVLTDKLRALYLRRAVYGDMRTVLETQFKMIKLKNGLIRLGVKNFDEIENQGKALAKVKLFEMLREAFEERATYAKLAGEAWKMTERKIKTILKNLENIGVSLSQAELDYVRDKANEKMYREAEHELSLIETAILTKGEIPYLTSKRKMVLEIMERLAKESGLQKPQSMLKLTVKEAC